MVVDEVVVRGGARGGETDKMWIICVVKWKVLNGMKVGELRIGDGIFC